jgi:hypothetical protein
VAKISGLIIVDPFKKYLNYKNEITGKKLCNYYVKSLKKDKHFSGGLRYCGFHATPHPLWRYKFDKIYLEFQRANSAPS